MKKKSGDITWLKYLNRKYNLCGLCGNSGVIDTRPTAISGAGIRSGIVSFCICPSGRCLEKQNPTALDEFWIYRSAPIEKRIDVDELCDALELRVEAARAAIKKARIE